MSNHISYDEFFKVVPLVTLKDSQSIKSSLSRNKKNSLPIIDEVLKGFQNPPIIEDNVVNEIILSMYNGDSLDDNSKKISEEHNLPLDIVTKIYEELDASKEVSFEHEGKKPLGKWTYHPTNYKGFEDARYGTGFQTTYLQELGLFFVVLDLDAHDNEKDIPMDNLLKAIPNEYLDTRIINTPTDGKHIFYLSKKPLQRKESPNINLDYRAIRESNVKKTNEGYTTSGYGGYIVSSYRWSFNGKDKEYYVWDEDSNPDILVIDSIDDVLSQIYSNLRDNDDISEELFTHLMEYDLEDDVKSIAENIEVTSNISHEKKEDSDNESNDSVNEKDSLKYDDNGMLLLNTDNGIQLLINQVGSILKKTKGKHRTILMGLDGGFERLGLPNETRIKVLLSGLKLANDLTSEHISQVKLSSSKSCSQGKKIGFPTILKEAPEVEGEIRIIQNIHKMFWRNITSTSYQFIEIPFKEILGKVSSLIKFNKELDNGEERKTDSFIYFNISRELDSYLEMMGVGLNERCKLLKQCLLILCENPSPLFGEYVKDKLTNGDKGYGKKRKGNNILPYKKTSFGKRLLSLLNLTDEISEQFQMEIDEISITLDIQLSHMKLENEKNPYIQPLINLVERPHGWQDYKRRQSAFKYLRENDFLKKTERHEYIFDSVETNSYIEITSRGLGSFLSKKYPILKIGIEEEELRKILSLSNEFDELKNEYYIFNNGVLKLHEREFIETNDFYEYFTIKKMDCECFFHKNPLQLNPSVHKPVNLWDKTLREILIPNYEEGNPNLDSGYYLDFMERVGSGFNTRIKDKKFVCYYGFGDNGKNILLECLKLTFGDRFLLVTMDTIQDEKLDLSEYDVLAIDELDKFSFDDAIAFIKRITGGDEDATAQREHYTHNAYVPKNPSAFFLFTNDIPQVDLSDEAFYRREDAIKLQNKFIIEPNPTLKNEFKEDGDLKEKLKATEEEGRGWLVNASLQAYYNRHDEEGRFKGFTRGQSVKETQMIVSNTNPIVKYLLETYEEDENKKSFLTNSQICEGYKNYCLRENIIYMKNGIDAHMGREIKELFGDIKVKKRNGMCYPLKIKSTKSDDDIIFQTNEEIEWEEVNENIPPKGLNNYYGVYCRVNELCGTNTPPTKAQLKREFGMLNIEEILGKLEDLELIYQRMKEDDKVI